MQYNCQFCDQKVERYTWCIRPPPYIFCGYECKENYREAYGDYKKTIVWNRNQLEESKEKETMNIVMREIQRSFQGCYVCGGGVLCCKNWVRLRVPGDHCGTWNKEYPICSIDCWEEYRTPHDSRGPYLLK